MQGNGLWMDVGNPKENEDLPCLQSRGKSKFGSLAMAFPLRISRRRILLSRKMCGLYQWEILVFFYFSRQAKSNLGKIASYTSHNFLQFLTSHNFITTKLDTQRTRAPWATIVFTANFLRLLSIFPVWEKLIAPWMQCIDTLSYIRQGGLRENYTTT